MQIPESLTVKGKQVLNDLLLLAETDINGIIKYLMERRAEASRQRFAHLDAEAKVRRARKTEPNHYAKNSRHRSGE